MQTGNDPEETAHDQVIPQQPPQLAYSKGSIESKFGDTSPAQERTKITHLVLTYHIFPNSSHCKSPIQSCKPK
ncbi:MAG: hypothetical protein CBB71_05470 [Rhodopirellula sp. TMED11]|nr:MAG: hypothetical protein CBB71_05470 [Rhodopirellula sp. TMED11]